MAIINVATEKQARRARDLHQDTLVAAGAHSISVEPLPAAAGDKTQSFGVVAWIDSKAGAAPARLPPDLVLKDKGQTVKVPLLRRESKQFQPE